MLKYSELICIHRIDAWYILPWMRINLETGDFDWGAIGNMLRIHLWSHEKRCVQRSKRTVTRIFLRDCIMKRRTHRHDTEFHLQSLHRKKSWKIKALPRTTTTLPYYCQTKLQLSLHNWKFQLPNTKKVKKNIKFKVDAQNYSTLCKEGKPEAGIHFLVKMRVFFCLFCVIHNRDGSATIIMYEMY